MASHAFGKQSIPPPTHLNVRALPQFYLSLAANPLQKKQNLFLQGRCEHVWAVPSLPAAKVPDGFRQCHFPEQKFPVRLCAA